MTLCCTELFPQPARPLLHASKIGFDHCALVLPSEKFYINTAQPDFREACFIIMGQGAATLDAESTVRLWAGVERAVCLKRSQLRVYVLRGDLKALRYKRASEFAAVGALARSIVAWWPGRRRRERYGKGN